MSYPEVVNKINIEFIRQLVRNGPDVHPGANFVFNPKNDHKKFLKYVDRNDMAAKLRVSARRELSRNRSRTSLHASLVMLSNDT